MKIKKLLRFYYSAGSLNRALDNIITRLALTAGQDAFSDCARYADKIATLIQTKAELGGLWARLDKILGAMTANDKLTLKRYAATRSGPKGEDKKEIHRAAVKFARRAGGLLAGSEKLYEIVCAYQCLMSPAPD